MTTFDYYCGMYISFLKRLFSLFIPMLIEPTHMSALFSTPGHRPPFRPVPSLKKGARSKSITAFPRRGVGRQPQPRSRLRVPRPITAKFFLQDDHQYRRPHGTHGNRGGSSKPVGGGEALAAPQPFTPSSSGSAHGVGTGDAGVVNGGGEKTGMIGARSGFPLPAKGETEEKGERRDRGGNHVVGVGGCERCARQESVHRGC